MKQGVLQNLQHALLILTLFLGKPDIFPGGAVHFRLEDPVERANGGKATLQRAVGVGKLPVFHQQQGISQPQEIDVLEKTDAKALPEVPGKVALIIAEPGGQGV